MAAKVVSILNLKGGVGKSTLTMILAEFLAFHQHKKVLAIDFDSQANLSTTMVRQLHIRDELEPGGFTTYHLFKSFLESKNNLNIEDYICPHREWVSNIRREPDQTSITLDMVISTQAMAGLDEEMLNMWNNPLHLIHALKQIFSQEPDRIEQINTGLGPVVGRINTEDIASLNGIRDILARALKPAMEKYDVVLIDCPPGLSLLTSAAIVASDFWISPIIPEPLALQGVGMVQGRITELHSRIKWAGSVLNKVIANRRTHDNESDRIYGTGAHDFPPYPTSQFNPFHWWIPDSEHLRKVSDFECQEITENFPYMDPTGHFTWVHGKYGATDIRLRNPQARARSRHLEEGPIYHLSGRLEKLSKEFMNRIGIK